MNKADIQDNDFPDLTYYIPDQMCFLIIDDDMDLLRTLFNTLVLKGHRVARAKGSLQGLLLSQRINFDFVLAEIILSDEDCLNNYIKIKQNNPKAKVIITINNNIDFPVVKKAEENGFEVVLKPFNIKEFFKRIMTIESF